LAHANIFFTDGHVASDYGLWHPDAASDTEGGRHRHNFIQAYLWECYQHALTDWLPSVCGNMPRVAWLGGDLVDGIQPKSPVCTDDPVLQMKGALAVYKPLTDTCEHVYCAGGTVFHAGKSATWDNAVAEGLGAVPDPAGAADARFARWVCYPIAVDGVTFNLAHHAKGSRVQSSRLTPLTNEYQTAAVDYYERDWPRADWIMRGHTHLYRPHEFRRAHVVFLPGFQAKTPHAWSLETGAPFDIGLFVVMTDEGRSWPEVKIYSWPTPKREVIGWTAAESHSQVSATPNGQPSSGSPKKGLLSRLMGG
jgi:prepilin-type processing-associated H-X9-DG protein